LLGKDRDDPLVAAIYGWGHRFYEWCDHGDAHAATPRGHGSTGPSRHPPEAERRGEGSWSDVSCTQSRGSHPICHERILITVGEACPRVSYRSQGDQDMPGLTDRIASGAQEIQG